MAKIITNTTKDQTEYTSNILLNREFTKRPNIIPNPKLEEKYMHPRKIEKYQPVLLSHS